MANTRRRPPAKTTIQAGVASVAMESRDHWTCQYSGKRLLFRGAANLIALRDPVNCPRTMSRNCWYWRNVPSLEHFIPVSVAPELRDDPDNWVTASLQINVRRGNRSLEDAGLSRIPPLPANDNWDGKLFWFLDEIEKDSSLLDNKHLRYWHRVATTYLLQAA